MAGSAPYEVFGIELVGISAENGRKLLLSIALVAAAMLARGVLSRVIGAVLSTPRLLRARFWIRQALTLVTALAIVFGLVSLWFDDPTRLATALGLVTAGLAFALQKVVTAIAGYFVILRGQTFSVGDRIVMGGVRGDVIGLTLTQTTIMEMGQPPPVQKDEPAMWIQARQFTGRLVTVSNARVFDEPVYNYTREFPYIWEEIAIPIQYTTDRAHVERLLLEVAGRHSVQQRQLSHDDIAELMRRYQLKDPDTRPKVFYRLTDNWLELTVRFLALDHGVRDLKDAMSREILQGLDDANIQIASATFELVGVPPLRFEESRPTRAPAPAVERRPH